MAPTERIRLPFRWQFLPVESKADGAVRWTWKAYTQTGDVALESDGSFETLTECMDDARLRGYGQP
jgi:hypothetical protein